ncbi:hypothetical protein [Gymnodinialimonas hymeniacidonis]|uniref:hypothetical protein n=1 Tax=Gymnodinialimonas hymeniacidonis TaxID=3126508 RepID=UPI0034C5C1BD
MSVFRALPLALCLSSPATAQEAFTWYYDALYPIDPNSAQLNLVATQAGFGPDTPEGRLPGGLIWARCLPFVDGGNVSLRFDAFPVAALAEDEYAFQLNDGAGTVLTLQGPLIPRGLNEPTGGLEVLVDHDGPEMAMLSSAPILTYGIVGFTDFQLPFDLSANQSYVSDFAQDCGDLTETLNAYPPAPETPVAQVLTPELGPDISGHAWTRLTLVDEFDPANTIVSMSYAVPESDDVLIAGECVLGQGDPFVLLQIAADVAGLQNGDPVDLRVQIPDGRSAVLQSNVIGIGVEFGIGGVEYIADISDPAWLVIAGDRTVRFDRPETGAGVTIDGNGPNTIGPFLADCAEAMQLTPESGGRPSTPIDPQPGFLACDNFGRVASRDTGTAQVVNFINSTDAFRALTWIDPAGTVVDITALNPGQASAFTTDPGHVWMATDGPGNCMEMMQVPAGTTDYRMTVISQ